MELLVKGVVDKVGLTAFDRGMFNAGIVADGKLLGEGIVDKNGAYEFSVKGAVLSSVMELMLYPSSITAKDAGTYAIRKPVQPISIKEVAGKADHYELQLNVSLPRYFLENVIRRSVQYHVHGDVYVQYPTYFEKLAGCRIDFYEVDPPFLSKEIPESKYELLKRAQLNSYIGSAYTDINGAYSFKFKFGIPSSKLESIIASKNEFSPFKPSDGLTILPFDAKPDIRARFLQFIDGEWTQVYEAPMTAFDWNIDKDFHRDYTIPENQIVPSASSGSAPATGFRFNSIGLLPVDATRIVDGYAFAQPGDPCGSFSCHPFCQTLRIHGLFAPIHAVTSYSVETLKTDASGSALSGETWKPLPDSLTNLQWNSTTSRWESITLGPTDGKFQNVDILPETDWLAHALKVIWRTTGYIDGFYKLRITGFNAGNSQVAQQELPMIRIDNSVPVADLDVISPSATICGDLVLDAARQITFDVTGYHSQGLVNTIYLWGSRGRYGETAGAPIPINRPDSAALWNGYAGDPVVFSIVPRTPTTITCSIMAYSFHIRVQGLGTNGSTINFECKRAHKTVNLVVTEPTS